MFKPSKPQHIVNKRYADENSGGGESGSKVLVAILQRDSYGNWTCDHTYEQLIQFCQNGGFPFLVGEMGMCNVVNYSSNSIDFARTIITGGQDSIATTYYYQVKSDNTVHLDHRAVTIGD